MIPFRHDSRAEVWQREQKLRSGCLATVSHHCEFTEEDSPCCQSGRPLLLHLLLQCANCTKKNAMFQKRRGMLLLGNWTCSTLSNKSDCSVKHCEAFILLTICCCYFKQRIWDFKGPLKLYLYIFLLHFNIHWLYFECNTFLEFALLCTTSTCQTNWET